MRTRLVPLLALSLLLMAFRPPLRRAYHIISGGPPVGSALAGRTWDVAFGGSTAADPWSSLVPESPTYDMAEQLVGSFTPDGTTTPPLLAAGIGAAQVDQAVSMEGACFAGTDAASPGDLPLLIRVLVQGGPDSNGQLLSYGNGADGLFVGENTGQMQFQGFGDGGSYNVGTFRATFGGSGVWTLLDVYYDGGTTLDVCMSGTCTELAVADIATGAALGAGDLDLTFGGGLTCGFQPTEGYSALWVSIDAGATWSEATHAADCVAIGQCAPAESYTAPLLFSTDFEREQGRWCRGEAVAFRPEDTQAEANCDATAGGLSGEYLELGVNESAAVEGAFDQSSGIVAWSMNVRDDDDRDFSAIGEMFQCGGSPGCRMSLNRYGAQIEFIYDDDANCVAAGGDTTGCVQVDCLYPEGAEPSSAMYPLAAPLGSWSRVAITVDIDTGLVSIYTTTVGVDGTPAAFGAALETIDCSSTANRSPIRGVGWTGFYTAGAMGFDRVRVGTTLASVE